MTPRMRGYSQLINYPYITKKEKIYILSEFSYSPKTVFCRNGYKRVKDNRQKEGICLFWGDFAFPKPAKRDILGGGGGGKELSLTLRVNVRFT
jgi:hypothetical protein